jgi:hypothetical protein
MTCISLTVVGTKPFLFIYSFNLFRKRKHDTASNDLVYLVVVVFVPLQDKMFRSYLYNLNKSRSLIVHISNISRIYKGPTIFFICVNQAGIWCIDRIFFPKQIKHPGKTKLNYSWHIKQFLSFCFTYTTICPHIWVFWLNHIHNYFINHGQHCYRFF